MPAKRIITIKILNSFIFLFKLNNSFTLICDLHFQKMFLKTKPAVNYRITAGFVFHVARSVLKPSVLNFAEFILKPAIIEVFKKWDFKKNIKKQRKT